ncbi:MAG: chalcone isomerase family protein [Pseudomonadota bacterium]
MSRFLKSLRAALFAVTCLMADVVMAVVNGPDIDPLDDMELVGKARMQVLFWDVYDAQLYAPGGIWNDGDPFALSLTYLRSLQGVKIAERSIAEIRKQGFSDERTLARWYENLIAIIPDVANSDEIIGVADDNAHTQFYLDGRFIGEIREPAFTRAFFAIWLGAKSSEPRFRDRLLGVRS